LITLRYLLSFAAQNNYKIDHLDVVTVFLNPEIDTKVYMQPLEGIEWLESTTMFSGNHDCFLRLNKALYDLQQVPRRWHQEIDSFLQSIGFLCSYVDALEVKQRLMLQYKVSNLGPLRLSGRAPRMSGGSAVGKRRPDKDGDKDTVTQPQPTRATTSKHSKHIHGHPAFQHFRHYTFSRSRIHQ
jgi:hypothetical protein